MLPVPAPPRRPASLTRARVPRVALFCLALAPLAFAPHTVRGQALEDVAGRDLLGAQYGFAVGLTHMGELGALEAFGVQAWESSEALTADRIFPFPQFTEVLIGMTLGALAAGEILDMDAALSVYLPDVSPSLGKVTFRQLLTHTAGLDNAELGPGMEWGTALEKLNERALFTEPGRIYSVSRYSYPLAVWAMEVVIGMPFPDIVQLAILDPLGLTGSTFDLEKARAMGLTPGRTTSQEVSSPTIPVEPQATRDGLPVFFTTAPDVLTLMETWLDGGVRGSTPQTVMPEQVPGREPGGAVFGGGLWMRDDGGFEQVYRRGGGGGYSAGLFVWPATRTVLLLWGAGGYPGRTDQFLTERIQEAQGRAPQLDVDALAARLGSGDAAIRSATEVPDSAPPEAAPVHWSGRYVNGDRMILLRVRDGRLVYDTGINELEVVRRDDDVFEVTLPTGATIHRLRFVTDVAGFRYVVQGSQAYRWSPP